MTALADILTRQITSEGPISIASYMHSCLLHPQHGYYTTQTAIGAQGDFITAPEISQMFGELIGLCLAQTWLDQGAPLPFALAELGPGRGTLMADIMRATRGVPGFHAAARLHLVEASPPLRAEQATRLDAYSPVWHDTVFDLPDLPVFAVANEFFDALPVRQFLRDGDHWRERVVGLRDGTLSFGLTAPLANPELDAYRERRSEGGMVTLCPAAPPIIAHLTDLICRNGGAAIVIDYGAADVTENTFQAVAKHETSDPLARPGRADLTAHVSFDVLARASNCCVSQLTTQGAFLERLGIVQRAQRLAETLTGTAQETHIRAFRRLTHPDEMGTLFKVMGFYPARCTPPPGLENDPRDHNR